MRNQREMAPTDLLALGVGAILKGFCGRDVEAAHRSGRQERPGSKEASRFDRHP